MKVRLLLLLLFTTASLCGQGLEVQPNDSMASVLQRQVGQAIELRMKSGEKLGGKLVKVTEKIVHLSQLTGAEYFDAMVSIEDVAAVVVRSKK